MAVISGQDAKVQVILEDAWGTYKEMDANAMLVDLNSESINWVPEMVEEDVLVGAKTSRRMDIVAVSGSGDLAMIMKPADGDAGAGSLLIACALGSEPSSPVESPSDVYTHTMEPIAGGVLTSLPSISMAIDRKADTHAYCGCEVSQMVLEAAAKDYLRGTFTFVAKTEETNKEIHGTPAYNDKIPFMFQNGSLSIAGGGTYSDAITGFTFTYSNNIEEPQQTMGSGLYMIKPEVQKRDITISMDTLFDADLNTFRETYFKTGATVAVVLTFTSTEYVSGTTPYKMTITLPKVVITSANPNVGGPDRITMTIEGRALEGALEACTIELVDGRSAKYI